MTEFVIAAAESSPTRFAFRRTAARAAAVVGFAAGAWLAGSAFAHASAQTPANPPALRVVAHLRQSPAEAGAVNQPISDLSVPVVVSKGVKTAAESAAPAIHEVTDAPVAKVVHTIPPGVKQLAKSIPAPATVVAPVAAVL